MGAAVPPEIRAFAGAHDEVEAVLQRSGWGTWDLVVLDASGNWTRGVFASDGAAKAVCEEVGIPIHDGWDADPRMARRMNALDAWSTPGAERRAL